MISSRDYALKLIEFRDRTEKEIRDKLLQKGYDTNETEDEIEFLKNYGYINDMRYAKHFTADAINIKKWGKIRIRAELLKRGIDREITDNTIEDAFEEADDERVFAQMQTRFKNSDFSNMKERTRIFNFFMRRGYTSEEIKGAMNKMCSFDDIISED
ncbi:MAG: regulatory protein RecX [Clostridia bacterium]|nr:regulatory protein RecX [Clostridia bacterium]